MGTTAAVTVLEYGPNTISTRFSEISVRYTVVTKKNNHMALTKANMAARLYDDIVLNKREAKEIVESFFEEISATLMI